MESSFKRYEKKYLVTRGQAAAFQAALARHMEPDLFGEYLVQNLYYDTEDWQVVRASIEKPLYKEKMRLRCYGAPHPESELYLELKKKYDGIVYKRRIALPAQALERRGVREALAADGSQIARELDCYMRANAPSERIYIAYRRTAFIGTGDPGLRVTFDDDVRFRLDLLDFSHPGVGGAILPRDKLLLEIKTFSAIPLWMARHLSEAGMFPTAFSKFGACYTDRILKQPERKVLLHA